MTTKLSIRPGMLTGKLAATPSRILYLDIETLPMETYVYERRQRSGYLNYPMRNQVTMACWAAQWGQEDVQSDHLTQKEMRGLDDSRITESVVALIEQADMVVGHNVDAFDLTQIRTRAMLGETAPLKAVNFYDTLKVARSHFTLESNSLRSLCHALGLPNKSNPPSDWAYSIMKFHDTNVMQEVVAYCRGDVKILPAVHERLQRYAK